MTVAISGILITDREMITPWDDDYPLDLGDPEEWESYRDVIDGLLPLSPTVLNDCLTNGLPLPRRQVEGVIIAQRLDLCSPRMPRRDACNGGTVPPRRAAQRILLQVRSPGRPQREA